MIRSAGNDFNLAIDEGLGKCFAFLGRYGVSVLADYDGRFYRKVGEVDRLVPS